MVIFDVAPQNFKILKQSAIQESIKIRVLVPPGE